MAGKAEEVMEGIKDITECCICTEMFTDPRMLPCIHTFCLLCLEKTGSESQKKPGDKMPCPLCRQEFIIPTEGLRGVQKNFFMERLIEMAKLSQPPDIIRYCDSCNSGQIENTTETPLAKMYCIECEENLCDDCTNYHKNQKQLKMHQVVAFGNQTLIGKLIKRAASNNCDHHTKYSIEMYCHDCQRAICMKCFAIDHKGHRSSDVEDVAEKFRRQIEVDIEKVKTSYADGLKIRAQVDVEKINYIKQVETAETEIIKRANELKDLVDKNMQSLLAQLVSRKAETLKTLQIERDEINMHLRILDSFKTYCSEIQDKGTPGDICRVVVDLCGQSSELERKHKSFTEKPMSSFSVIFEKTNLEGLLSERNIIGTLEVRTIKPNILKGPTDLVITEHEDAIFSATIDGKPEPRVQWLKNDREIKPSERFVLAKKDQTHWLTIKNAHLDDVGQYSVRSVNDAGELTATARLTVNEKLWAPFFTKKMIDKSLNEQDTVFFECTVSAKPLPLITWFKEGMELRESSRIKIVSARGGENEMKLSFTLTDAVLSDSGQFVVRAKNSEGEASCSASLTVTVMTVMPIFLRGPSDLVVIEHEDASFSAAINGKPEPKVQWLKNGREIKPSEVYIMTKKDQTHSLTIKNTRLDDGGQYSVKAVNEGGELVSTAKLTVKEKLWAPVFTKKLIDRSFFEHDPVVLECAVSAKPPPSVIWTKDGKPLREDSRLKFDRVNEGNTDFKLSMTLTDGKLNDSGQYRVVVKNTEGEASNKGHLTVKIRTEKPWLLRGPTNLKIEEESSGSFVASVDGKPYPEIQWLKDSVPLTIGGRFITKSSGVEQTLIIKEAKRRDAGVYTIKATNEAGELKASATLEVLDMSPYFLDMLKDVMVSEGMSAVFVCKVYPDSAPVVWHTEETEVSPLDTRYKISTKGNERRLEIVRASRHDYGIITASVGELQSNATLTVEASETEIVETRLLWKIVEDEFMRAAAEFQCTRNRDTAIMRIESMSDPSVAVTDRVQSATQRRWVVKKAYISRDGEFRVDRWSVRSHVDYTITEEGLRDASLGRLDRARYSKQTVEFVILLMEPTAESRWLKDGESISPGSKYDMVVGQDGLVHVMVINDVQQSDEGIYTFMVLRQKIEAHITVEGSGPTQVYHSSTSSPGRLLSVKSRREVDTEALMSQLPSEIQKKKIGSKIIMTYDNRQQIETPTSETLQNQLHEFDAKVTGFEEEEVSDEEPEQEEVFGDEGDGAAKPRKERRSSLVHARASLPQPLSQLSRSGSLSSLSFAGGGRLGGRAKSEILYFAYTESGKDRPKLDF